MDKIAGESYQGNKMIVPKVAFFDAKACYTGLFNSVNQFLTEVADVFLFISLTIKETFSRDFEFREFLRQCFQMGYKSLPLISVTGIIMGLVLTIQSRPVLVNFGAVTMLPGMVAVSLIKEIGPVITALICA
jgi:phospholipid/cholesterol/gamma-HCH transport system permease protein